MIGIHGFRSETPENMMLGPGKIWQGIDQSELEGSGATPYQAAVADATPWGATRGGNSFVVDKQFRTIPADGLRQDVVGMKEVQSLICRLTLNLLESTWENIKASIGVADVTAYNSYRKIKPRLDINDSDYITNLALAATIKGKSHPSILVIENALATDAVTLQLPGPADAGEVVIAVTFTGHAAFATPDIVPATVYHPIAAAS